MRPMPRLLTRAILLDLLRTGAVTTVILVTVIAFGAALKPLAREDLFSVGQTVRYVFMAMVPMLEFALPFAAGFSATMTMHRMAIENELVAAAGCGIAYRTLLRPVLLLGVLLLVAMAGLTQQVIPRFLERLEDLLQKDILLLFQTSIGAGESVRIGDLLLWADDMAITAPPPGSGAEARLVLFRVAVAGLDATGRVEADLTAERVVLDVERDAHGTTLNLRLTDAVAYKPGDGMLAWVERPEAAALHIPRAADTHVRSMTGAELRALRARPDPFPAVDEIRRLLAQELQDMARGEALDRALATDGPVTFTREGDDGTTFLVQAAGFGRGRFEPEPGTDVVVVEYRGAEAIRRYRSRVVRLVRSEPEGLGPVLGGLRQGRGLAPADEAPPRSALVLEPCEWTDLRTPEVANRRASLRLEALDWAADPGAARDADAPTALSVEALRAAVARLPEADQDRLAALRDELDLRVDRLVGRIDGRLARRHATAATAPLLLLLGAVLAMLLRQRSALAVYAVAFLPAVLSLILISGGEQVMRDGRPVGGAVLMWSGHAATLLVTAGAWLRLRRN